MADRRLAVYDGLDPRGEDVQAAFARFLST